ncbi:unnamed protein product [Strongylus vulgaris]|uniref:SCP domain-containing protein n=1 Tax=Strongylus vulgaris TaxID=40348 RepID=A0A3P7IDU2_STRVU|nr:unnamed protein product [Strongylus vulgaris]
MAEDDCIPLRYRELPQRCNLTDECMDQLMRGRVIDIHEDFRASFDVDRPTSKPMRYDCELEELAVKAVENYKPGNNSDVQENGKLLTIDKSSDNAQALRQAILYFFTSTIVDQECKLANLYVKTVGNSDRVGCAVKHNWDIYIVACFYGRLVMGNILEDWKLPACWPLRNDAPQI